MEDFGDEKWAAYLFPFYFHIFFASLTLLLSSLFSPIFIPTRVSTVLFNNYYLMVYQTQRNKLGAN
jgi:hypothetical protein